MVSKEELKKYRIEKHQRSLQDQAIKLAQTSKGREQMRSLWLFYTQPYLPNIADCRKAAGLTQKELAEKVGISRQSLISYELNTNSPTLDILSKLAKALSVTLNDITVANPESDMSYEDFEKNIDKADMFIVIDDSGNRLNEIRRSAGLSIKELALLSKTTAAAIVAIEEGSERGVTRDIAKRICQALDKSVEDVFNL